MTNSIDWKQPYYTERHQVDNCNARQVDFQDCTFSVNIQINPTANDAWPIITHKQQKFCIRNQLSNTATASITSIKSAVYTNNFHLQVLSTKLQQRTRNQLKFERQTLQPCFTSLIELLHLVNKFVGKTQTLQRRRGRIDPILQTDLHTALLGRRRVALRGRGRHWEGEGEGGNRRVRAALRGRLLAAAVFTSAAYRMHIQCAELVHRTAGGSSGYGL
jgi:hypothetical protein